MKKQKFKLITDKKDSNGDFTYISGNGRSMVNLHGNIFDTAKTVYAYFNEEGRKLDPQDNSWDVEHIDGNLKNNHISNLRFKDQTGCT